MRVHRHDRGSLARGTASIVLPSNYHERHPSRFERAKTAVKKHSKVAKRRAIKVKDMAIFAVAIVPLIIYTSIFKRRKNQY